MYAPLEKIGQTIQCPDCHSVNDIEGPKKPPAAKKPGPTLDDAPDFGLGDPGQRPAYRPIVANTVLAGRVRLGTLVGANAADIAPSRRFYSGGGGSVRGYGYQRLGPRDLDGDPTGGPCDLGCGRLVPNQMPVSWTCGWPKARRTGEGGWLGTGCGKTKPFTVQICSSLSSLPAGSGSESSVSWCE